MSPSLNPTGYQVAFSHTRADTARIYLHVRGLLTGESSLSAATGGAISAGATPKRMVVHTFIRPVLQHRLSLLSHYRWRADNFADLARTEAYQAPNLSSRLFVGAKKAQPIGIRSYQLKWIAATRRTAHDADKLSHHDPTQPRPRPRPRDDECQQVRAQGQGTGSEERPRKPRKANAAAGSEIDDPMYTMADLELCDHGNGSATNALNTRTGGAGDPKDSRLLTTALRALEEDVAFFGMTDRFSESVCLWHFMTQVPWPQLAMEEATCRSNLQKPCLSSNKCSPVGLCPPWRKQKPHPESKEDRAVARKVEWAELRFLEDATRMFETRMAAARAEVRALKAAGIRVHTDPAYAHVGPERCWAGP